MTSGYRRRVYGPTGWELNNGQGELAKLRWAARLSLLGEYAIICAWGGRVRLIALGCNPSYLRVFAGSNPAPCTNTFAVEPMQISRSMAGPRSPTP